MMNFKDAFKSVVRLKPDTEEPLLPLSTPYGESLKPDQVLQEYPRPQMVRASYLNLNGYWDYAITKDSHLPNRFYSKILVPFSPEAALSGVNRQLKPTEYLWYHRELSVDPEAFILGKRMILHFGAVDYHCVLYINGKKVLKHEGGYLPFEADITSFLTTSQNELVLMVQDPTGSGEESKGKQSLKRSGIFYTAQSGIWQTVWAEWVEPSYIKAIKIDASYDTGAVTILATVHDAESQEDYQLTDTLQIDKAQLHAWTPEDPYLYDISFTFRNDKVSSYYAFRTYTIEKVHGIPRFCLNHKPYFLNGVLDQGYFPDGLYTAPSDQALIDDITAMKKLKFNMLRKHIKVEAARWYYHCDRLGMIVCQDMVNGGSAYHMGLVSYLPTLFPQISSQIRDSHYTTLSRKSKQARIQWEKECMETIETLSCFPSIAIWCPFNEGWGQFDTERITSLIKQKDPSRLVDSASGWFDQGCGDFISIHNYFRELTVPVKKWENRALLLSEYGGYACHIDGHSSVKRIFGYKRYDNTTTFSEAFHKLIQKKLLPLEKEGLSGAVFTQLSDVEEEVNGILTYDRKVNKLHA